MATKEIYNLVSRLLVFLSNQAMHSPDTKTFFSTPPKRMWALQALNAELERR
jgi:hypothetical protein